MRELTALGKRSDSVALESEIDHRRQGPETPLSIDVYVESGQEKCFSEIDSAVTNFHHDPVALLSQDSGGGVFDVSARELVLS